MQPRFLAIGRSGLVQTFRGPFLGTASAPVERARDGPEDGEPHEEQGEEERLFHVEAALQSADEGVGRARLLLGSLRDLDNYIAATQLGITMSSLALGWLGEPALAHLVEPPVEAVVGEWAEPGGKERDVRVRLPDEVRRGTNAVADLPLIRRGNQMVTVRQVAETSTEDKPSLISRVNRQRVATLGADPEGVPLGTVTCPPQE